MLVAGCALVVPLLTKDPTSFTGRGGLWHVALEQWSRSPIFGAGSTAWLEQYERGHFDGPGSYSPHNAWVDALLASGLVGCLLLGASVLLSAREAVRGSGAILACLLTPVMIVGITEQPVSFYGLAGGAFLLPAILLTPPSRFRDDNEPRADDQANLQVRTAA